MAENKLILLTGGNSGIGLAACKILCSEGHKVVASVRSEEKGSITVQEVENYYPGADIHYLICSDMSDPSAIRQLAREFKSKHLSDGQTLDILVNNAGTNLPVTPERVMCSHHPEWELTLATNCLGPILLADLLKEDLKKSAEKHGEAIIIMVSSLAIIQDDFVPFVTVVDDINMDRSYQATTMVPYKNAKTCLAMASMALADELAESKVAVHIMCPGMTPDTNLGRATTGGTKLLMNFLRYCCCCIYHPQSVHKGGMVIVDLATHGVGRGTTGKFRIRGKEPALTPQFADKSKYPRILATCRKMVAE